jgi:hypothetical protein
MRPKKTSATLIIEASTGRFMLMSERSTGLRLRLSSEERHRLGDGGGEG